MQRDYMKDVEVALREGMKPEEVQNLFEEILQKSNRKGGKRVVRLFAKGIGKAKKKSLAKQNQEAKFEYHVENQLEKSRQYVYK